MLSNTRLWICAGMFLSLVACANKPVEKASDFAQADRNGDGKVSLTDFSIMIFNWTG